MNKIIIDNGKLKECSNKNIVINENIIQFIENDEYKIEINDTKKVNLKFIVKDNCCVKIFLFSVGNNVESNIVYELGENSNLLLFKFFNNINCFSKEEIYLNGKYSKISYNFSGICKERDEYRIKIFHNDNSVSSNVSNKFIGNDGSKIRFYIDSILDKGNCGCYMNQDTKIICMGDVDAGICPNMYIEDDDVEARHGSVIGNFSWDDYFYLMSRGISKNEALKLMIRGFLLSNLVLGQEDYDTILNVINDNYNYK